MIESIIDFLLITGFLIALPVYACVMAYAIGYGIASGAKKGRMQ